MVLSLFCQALLNDITRGINYWDFLFNGSKQTLVINPNLLLNAEMAISVQSLPLPLRVFKTCKCYIFIPQGSFCESVVELDD